MKRTFASEDGETGEDDGRAAGSSQKSNKETS